jgi:hypothetical protein
MHELGHKSKPPGVLRVLQSKTVGPCQPKMGYESEELMVGRKVSKKQIQRRVKTFEKERSNQWWQFSNQVGRLRDFPARCKQRGAVL